MLFQFGRRCETAVRLDVRNFFRPFEVFAQPFAKLQASSKGSRFNCGQTQAQRFRRLLCGEPFYVSQYEDHSQARTQLLQRYAQNLS